MLWDKEKKELSYKRIMVWVLAGHLAFLLLLKSKDADKKTFLRPKLSVQNFTEKKPVAKAAAVSENLPEKAPAKALEKNRPHASRRWEEKREEFFQDKLDNFAQTKKSKEAASEKEKADFKALVEAEQRLKEQRPKTENKKTAEKKTSSAASKTTSSPRPKNGSPGRRGSGPGKQQTERKRNTELLRQKKRRQLQKLKRSLSKINTDGKAVQQSRKKSFSADELAVPEFEKDRFSALLEWHRDDSAFILPERQNDFSRLFVDFLKTRLLLPGKGKVKVRLLLLPSGEVGNIDVLDFENAENRSYILQNLPLLNFDFLKGYLKKEKSFIITFLSEEEN